MIVLKDRKARPPNEENILGASADTQDPQPRFKNRDKEKQTQPVSEQADMKASALSCQGVGLNPPTQRPGGQP